MEFAPFKRRFIEHFESMIEDVNHLFVAAIPNPDAFWEFYLASFPEGSNPLYRTRTEHDCSCCRHFIKQYGGIVKVKDGKVDTLWNFDAGNPAYQEVINAMDTFVRSFGVRDVAWFDTNRIGTDYNWERTENSQIKWEHYSLDIPNHLITRRTMGDFQGSYRVTHDVFRRSLEEVSVDAIESVLELIYTNTLYKGEEWKNQLERFLHLKKQYDKIARPNLKDLFVWEHTPSVGVSIGHIRNHSIGTLLVNVSGGMDLDTAVHKYEVIVAPSNYKRPKAIYTKKMVEDAKKTIQNLGYEDSLGRRFATLDDISVNNILFVDRNAAKRVQGGDPFSELMASATAAPKNYDHVETITADSFVKHVLPLANKVELLLENRHAPNMVSLVAPKDASAPSMFKWNNGFSWAYSGNMTDSEIRQNVQKAGGSVTGDLRFSIQWNDGKTYNANDFDAHCYGPHLHISYMAKKDYKTMGELDVDYIVPVRGKPCVENITFPDRRSMKPGTYEFFVHCFSDRGGTDGFKAEIEFDGVIHSYHYPHRVAHNCSVAVATVTLDKNGNFTIENKLPSDMVAQDLWNLKTNDFVPVSTVMYSPNYWDEQQGIGHKHYFFMLEGCINPDTPNGFYNEFLRQELMNHKRVFEALGAQLRVDSTGEQLSGVGFSSTKRNDVIVRVTGATKRLLKIQF